MLTSITVDQFKPVYEIMEASFPSDEMRPENEQRALLSLPAYQILAEFDAEDHCLGFLAVWEFDGLRYIEHFAVSEKARNCGAGTRLLREYLQRSELPVVLECEPPLNLIASRRIGFYERNGFVFNAYNYVQPPISAGRSSLELKIMSWPTPLTPEQFASAKRTLYREVYRKDAE